MRLFLLLLPLPFQIGNAVIHADSGNIFLQGRGHHKSASSTNKGKSGSSASGDQGDHYLPMDSGNETEPVLHIQSEGETSKGKGASSRSSSKGAKADTNRSKGASTSSSKGRSYLLPTASDPPTSQPTFVASLDADIPARSSTQCQANSQEGNFGATARGDQNFVVYMYQVQTEQQITRQQFATILLPQLELAIVNGMIPYLFGRLCGLFLQRQQQVAPLLHGKSFFLGVSMNPADRILDNGTLVLTRIKNQSTGNTLANAHALDFVQWNAVALLSNLPVMLSTG
jgi:hypothetical protein